MSGRAGVQLNVGHVRAYRGGDEAGITAVWNEALHRDPIDGQRFVRQVLCDANFDPEGLRVAVEGDEIVGFCLALGRKIPLWGADLEPHTGWITAFGVRPDRQGRGVGGALLGEAEAYLRDLGKTTVSVSPYAPNYFWPGVDRAAYPAAAAMLERRGYAVMYQAAAMDRNIVGFTVPDDVRALVREREAEGYVFPPLSPSLLHDTVQFAGSEFSPDWARALRDAVARGISWDQIHLALAPEGRVVGFAMYGAYDGIPERFGPFGVDSSQRGKGLGKILLYQSLKSMWSKSLHGAWFLWTGEQTAAGLLYKKAGFETTRRFDVFKKADIR